MNRQLRRLPLGLLGLILVTVAAPALAAPSIDGRLQFVVGVTLNSPLDTASAFTSFFGPLGTGNPVVMSGASGAYSIVPAGTQVNFATFTFNPGPETVPGLWSFDVGNTTFSFDATSVNISLQDTNFLQLEGQGIAHITGFADSIGYWSIADTGDGPVFTLGSSILVPEPSSISLLMASLLAWGVAWRSRR